MWIFFLSACNRLHFKCQSPHSECSRYHPRTCGHCHTFPQGKECRVSRYVGENEHQAWGSQKWGQQQECGQIFCCFLMVFLVLSGGPSVSTWSTSSLQPPPKVLASYDPSPKESTFYLALRLHQPLHPGNCTLCFKVSWGILFFPSQFYWGVSDKYNCVHLKCTAWFETLTHGKWFLNQDS